MTDRLEVLADLIAAELRQQLGVRGGASTPEADGDNGGLCPPHVCDAACDGAHCVAHCPEKVRRMVELGAQRFSAGPGVGACDNVLARMIDHTLLAPAATRKDIEALCDEAAANCFATVCVNPWWAGFAVRRLAQTPVRVCTVVGFPLGANRPETKVYEAVRGVEDGATELDMVQNVGALKSGDYTAVERDIVGVVKAAAGRANVKVILETGLLTDEEKVKACTLAQAAGAHFVKTSTGFGPGGATENDIRLMRRVIGGKMGVKASGGVKDQPTALRMIEAGATRIGASAGVRIVHGNGRGPERSYGAEAPTERRPASPRATIHKL